MGFFQNLFSSETVARVVSEVSLAEFDELRRQFKVLQRELDDLHAAYRRLRAFGAQQSAATRARAPDQTVDPDRATDGGNSRVERKRALRERARKMQHGSIEPNA